MAAESNHGTSQPICMDINPEVTEGYGTDPAAPEVKLVRSGRGLWVEKKAVPCVVCLIVFISDCIYDIFLWQPLSFHFMGFCYLLTYIFSTK